eukprot:CAMPEP_0203888340 /NCGR_PEP_ID=MMETSP0359-20131031/31964_1 /ASSEMBLY_ACC=CAM_ASM_000338 /TAXON_ID=268821 /ORGANISM="Scrippsiella Hangoei, Strain SHTV-5" /LENGTH=148 /DNA_ID=CAMNT_0050809523 /DNA_START=268 /DNA_END=714 /DNA_ORIENTATION=+
MIGDESMRALLDNTWRCQAPGRHADVTNLPDQLPRTPPCIHLLRKSPGAPFVWLGNSTCVAMDRSRIPEYEVAGRSAHESPPTLEDRILQRNCYEVVDVFAVVVVRRTRTHGLVVDVAAGDDDQAPGLRGGVAQRDEALHTNPASGSF